MLQTPLDYSLARTDALIRTNALIRELIAADFRLCQKPMKLEKLVQSLPGPKRPMAFSVS